MNTGELASRASKAILFAAVLVGASLATPGQANANQPEKPKCGVARAPFPTSLVAPSLEGKATAGRTVKVEPGTWDPSPITITYQWSRSHKGRTYAIQGATHRAYTVTKADLPYGLSVTLKIHSPACAQDAVSGGFIAREQPVWGYTHPKPPGKWTFAS